MVFRPRVLLLLLALALVASAASSCGSESEEAADTGLGVLSPAVSEPVEPQLPSPPPPPPLEVRVARGKPIGPGSRGDNVAALQEALALLGYEPGKVDGAYGPRTREAIVAFQKDHDLEPDGFVGQETARAINEELRTSAPG